MLKKLLINVIAFYIVSYLLPGVIINGWSALLVVAVVWGLLSVFIKPLVVLFTLPINILTLGLFSLVINAVLILVMGRFVDGFYIRDFLTALIAGLLLSILNGFLSKLD